MDIADCTNEELGQALIVKTVEGMRKDAVIKAQKEVIEQQKKQLQRFQMDGEASNVGRQQMAGNERAYANGVNMANPMLARNGVFNDWK